MSISYVAWRIGRSGFSKWHLSTEPHWTLCGREIPTHPYAPPTYAPVTHFASKGKPKEYCHTCWDNGGQARIEQEST